MTGHDDQGGRPPGRFSKGPRDGSRGGPRGAGPRQSPRSGSDLRVYRAADTAGGLPSAGEPRHQRTNKLPRFSPDVARNAAVLLLWAVLEERLTLDEAMSRSEPYRVLDARDRGFCAAITLATLRRLGQIDGLINARLTKPLPETAHYVRALLRIAIGQWIEELAPDHAIADSAVALARADKIAFGMSGLVNAIIRRIQREVTREELTPAMALAAPWRARWSRALGPDRAEIMAQVLLRQPPLDLSSKPGFDPGLLADLEAVSLPNGSVRIPKPPADITALPGWSDGSIWVQDAAARLPVLALGNVAGQRILDMCAAPGGKTLQLLANGAEVVALDTDERRLDLVRSNLSRTGLTATCVVGDARTFDDDAGVDAVLLDAPCSATGTGRRHPEAQWIRDPRDVTRYLGIQSQLIAAAARLVKPGGTVVFAICSLEAEERDAAMAAAAGAGLTHQPLEQSDFPWLPDHAFKGGCFATAPDIWADQGGMDGFFVARFLKA
jgi:16S rRNA (cytosine967-C5)-methyltransferase